jgi:hypothetical protein
MEWQPGYPTNLNNPIRDFSETSGNTIRHYTLKLDMPNLEFRCSASSVEDGIITPLEISVEEFCNTYDRPLWGRINFLKEFNNEDRLDREILARLGGVSITTMNEYLRVDRPILLKYGGMGWFPRWIGPIVVADFVPFHYVKPPKISGYCGIKTSVITEALKSGQYEYYNFRGITIPLNMANRMKYEIIEKEDEINGKYSLPYVGARAAERFGEIDNMNKVDYVRLYNTLFQKMEKRKNGKLKYTTRGLTTYVSEEVKESLLDMIPIELASRRLGKTIGEVREIGQGLPFDKNKTWFVSRAWLTTELGRYDVEVSLPKIDMYKRRQAYSNMWEQLALARDKKKYDMESFDASVALFATELQDLLHATPVPGDPKQKITNSLSVLRIKMGDAELDKIYEVLQRYTKTGEGLENVIFFLSWLHSQITGNKNNF